MKTQKLVIWLLAIALVVSNGVWLYREAAAVTWQEKQEYLCRCELNSASDFFSRWQKSGSEADYRNGAACFYSAEMLYHDLADERGHLSDYTSLNRLYGLMVLYPEKCMAEMDAIVEAVGMLASDLTDPNAPLRMDEICNRVEMGG